MKTRLFFVSALAVAAIAFVGCNKIESSIEVINNNGYPFEFTASQISSKTVNDGVSTNWAADDNVNLFHAVAGSTSYISDGEFTASEAGESVTFTGTLAEELTADNYDWYAIYPYNTNISTPANTGTKGYVTIGSAHNGTQAQTGNNSKAHLAGNKYPVAGKATNVAKDTKPVISFAQLSSVIAVKVTNGTESPITVSEVSFTGTERINGTFYIDFVSSPVVYTSSGDGYTDNTADLTVTSGTPIAVGDYATFYLAVKPFTAPAAGTISLSVTADNGEQVRNKELEAAATFAAGKINTLNFTYDKAPSGPVEPSAVTGWYRVEKADWLTVGDRVIIANHDGTKAMSKVQKTNNRDGVDVDTETSGDYRVLTNNDNIQMFILEEGTASGSFAFWADNGDDASKYMYAASSSNNYLKFQTSIDANASFIATLVDGLGNLTAQGSNTRKVVQWNGLFACYSAASWNDISIYKYYGVWAGSTTCANPTISQEGSTITISCTTPGVKIYYTTDGTTPTTESTLYSAPFAIATPVTVKAIATRSHYTNSEVVSQACTVKVATPVINCTGTAFTITCATDGATIYYETSTTDLASVDTPTTSSSEYSGAVDIAATTYVKAIAVKDGCTNSEVASETCVYSSGPAALLTCDMTLKTANSNAYNTTTTYGNWKIKYGANNNGGWAYYKMGGKKATLVDDGKNPCEIYSTTAIGAVAGSVVVHLPAGSLSKTGMGVTSWGVEVYSDSSLETKIDTAKGGGTITNSAGTFTFTPSDDYCTDNSRTTWPSGSYFKVVWNLTNTTTTNGIVCVDKVTVYGE